MLQHYHAGTTHAPNVRATPVPGRRTAPSRRSWSHEDEALRVGLQADTRALLNPRSVLDELERSLDLSA